MAQVKPLRGVALGEQNGRLMAAYDFYTLANNPHRKGSRPHAAFVAAFNKARLALITQKEPV